MLELEDLCRRFGDLQALDHLTFAVPRGEVFGFLGPNGAGKTTAMRAIFALVSLGAGRVRWKGAEVSAEERHRFGYLPPTAPLAMPALAAVGRASTLDVAISAVITLVGAVLLMRVAAKIYNRALLRTGRRLKVREVLVGPGS